MPIRIPVPGRGVAEFPDGTTYDQAFASIQEEVPDFQPSREDTFAAMRQKSEAFAGPDNARFLGDTGAIQGFLEQTAGKTAAGIGSMAAAAGRVLDMPLDSHYKAEEKAGRPVNRIEAKFRNPFQSAADQAAAVDTTGPTSQFLSDVAGGVLPSAVAGLLTGGVGAAGIAGAQQFGDTRKRVLDYYKSLGLPEYEAQSTADQLGALSGAITAAATKYTPQLLGKIPGVGKYLGEQGAEGLAKKLLIDRLKQSSVGEIAKRVVGNAAGEATEEGVNQFLLEVVESKQLEPNLSWEEIAKRTGMAAAQGAVGGAGVSAIGEGIRKGMDVAITSAYPNVNQRYGNDAVREHAANQLAEMFGFEKPHTEPKLSLPAPQKFAIDQDAATRDALAKENALLANQQAPIETQPPPLPDQSTPHVRPQPQVVVQSSRPISYGQVSVGDKMVRAIGVKSLIARGVDPGVAASFANLVAPTIQASTTEDARDQINAAFDKAGLLDSGANTFSTEANIRNAQAVEGWNESDVQNMLYDRRARDKEIADHNRKIIAQLNGSDQTQSATQLPPLPAPQTPNPLGGESTNEGQDQGQIQGETTAPVVTEPTLPITSGSKQDSIGFEKKAIEILDRDGRLSISRLQREFKLSYKSAEDLVRKLASDGVITRNGEGQPWVRVAANAQPQISRPSAKTELGAGAASPQASPGPEINAPAGNGLVRRSVDSSGITKKVHGTNIQIPSAPEADPESTFASLIVPVQIEDNASDAETLVAIVTNEVRRKLGDSFSTSTATPESASKIVEAGSAMAKKYASSVASRLESRITKLLKESRNDLISSGVSDSEFDGWLKMIPFYSQIAKDTLSSANIGANSDEATRASVAAVKAHLSIVYGLTSAIGGGRIKSELRDIISDVYGLKNKGQQTVEKPQLSLADRLYNKLDEMDKGLNQNVYASITGLEVPVAKLVLKTAKLAIRAGQSVAEAVRSAIAKAKQQFPDAKFDSAAFEKSILADLQPLLSGQEEQSVIAQAAEPFVKANEDAAARIDQVALTGVQLGKARQDLRDKRDEVVQLALAQGIPVSDIPSESSSKLAEVAASLGGDAAGIQDIQARVNHEERARELHGINKQIGELTDAETKLLQASPSKYADVLSYLAESKSKLAEKAAKSQFDDVRARASEIATQEAEKISNTAKRDALQNGHVVSAIIGPVEEMRKLLEETPELQGRTAEEMLADPLVSDDTKQLFVIRMSSAFRSFDQSRENLESDLISSEQSLAAAIERLQGKLADARMDKAFADIVISDAGRALRGETGLAGGLNPKWVEWYDQNQSAIRSFARSLATATGPNAITAQKLMDWIRFGVDASAMPELRNTAAHNWGVGDEVLNEIKTILLESRATRNAVALIYSAGNQKLAAHELRKIATAAAGGDEVLANALFDKLIAKTDSEKAKLTALSRELSSELEKKRLELETLKEAKLLFDRVATSPTFVDGRNAVENAHGSFMQQFLLRKNDQLGFSGFKMPDGSEQPNIEITGGMSGTAGFDKVAGEALLKWNNNAEAYVSQYEVAQDDFDSGAGPNPVQLGFDPAVYRGLKYTLNYEMPGILDGTLFNPGENVDYSGMNQLFQSLQWFRQIDATARKVKGVFGNAMRQAVTDFRDVNMLLGTVASDPAFTEIPKLLSAAMASHKSVGGESFLNRLGPVGRKLQERFAVNGNLEKYRELVFNPMANIGRGFGTLKVGTVLPTGEVVTQADIDLLKRAQERDRALLKIAQRRGKGQSQGYGGKEFRREAGSVGDLGTPRHINNYGEDFIRSLAIAARQLGRGSAFTWEQLASGSHPVLQVWRAAAADHFALNAHVHDSAYRTDRDVQVHPFMRQAYRNLAESMEAGGYLTKIDSVGELAEQLVQHFPADTGFDPRQFVLDQLNNEIGQYSRNAIATSEKFASDSGENIETILKNGFGPTRLRSSSIVETETSNNEFTKPAGTLKIPSSFYDYSSISPVEMTLSKSRAIGERVVDMKNAMRAAITSLNTTIAKLSTSNDLNAANAIAKELNMSVSEATAYLENVRDNLNGLDAALGRNWTKDNVFVSGAKQVASLGVGGALSGIATGAMNVMSSPASAFVLHSMINRGGSLALGFNTARFAAKLTRNVVYGAIHAVSESTASTFKSGFDYLEKHAPFLRKAMDQFSDSVVGNAILKGVPNVIGYSQFVEDVDAVRSLGFSQQRGLFTQIGNSIRDALQYQTKAEQVRAGNIPSQIGRSLRFPIKTSVRALSEALKFTVQEMTDTIVNATAISDLRNIDASLKELAIKWASDRISKGMTFDPSNPEFLVRPDEYRKHGKIGRMSSEDNLSHAKAFAQLAGTNLEKILWDYYQSSDKGSKDVSVFGESEDSFKRIVIGAINASTFTNRPIKAQTDTDVGIIQALTGFSTNMAIGMSIAMKGSSGNERTWKRKMRKIFEALGKIMAGFVAFVVIGSLADASRELVNRLFTGKISRKLTSVDPEFWDQKPSKLAESLTKNALMIAPFLGGLARIQDGIRPDAGSSLFPIALINSLANYAMGLVRLPKEDWGWLAGNFVRERLPITQNIPLGSTSGPESAKTKISAGVASFASSADAAGLVKPNLSGVSAGGVVPITEKTGMLSKLAEAGMAASIAERKGDAEGIAEANTEIEHQKQRLIDYHRKQIVEDNERRGITSSDFKVEKDAIAAARRDWSGMNPIARVLGHQPTQSEMDRINAQLSGDRRAAADLAWNAFSRMSDQFPTAKGATPPAEMVKTPRAGGGSRFGYSAPVALSVGRGGRSSRRVSLRRSGRTRLGGRSRLRTKTRGLRLRRR